MFILESIQEFNGMKIGIYNEDKESARRIRKAERELSKKGIPSYAIFINTKKIKKGFHEVYINTDSFIKKDKDGCNNIETTIKI